MTHRHVPTTPPPNRPSLKPPTMTIRPVDDDEFVLRIEYLDQLAGGAIASQDVDLGPHPTWPSISDQLDLIATGVRNVWAASWYYYTGEVAEPDLIPDMDASWKAIRRAADALAEVVDNATESLMTDLGIEFTEENAERVSDQVYRLVTKGK